MANAVETNERKANAMNERTSNRKDAVMATSSLLSLSEIIANYRDRTVWEGAVCGYELTDGTRLVATKCGTGFRIYRQGPGNAQYVAFS